MKAYDIPNIINSLKADVEGGNLSLHEAAIELHVANYTSSVDDARAEVILGLVKE